MGLIKAGLGAAGGVLADQWKEFFYCDSLGMDTLVVKGQKRITSRSSNTKGNDNIISNGSGIAVADGQCMIIVEQGKIVDICAETGEYTYNSSTEPSIFAGNLGESIKETFKTVGKRFTFGGDTAKDQRIYYINTKEILDNKFGTANPFMFRVVNSRAHMDRTVNVRCNGIYSYRISDPLLFYTKICANVEGSFERDQIDNQLKTDFISALQPAFAKLSALELRPSDIPAHSMELEDAMGDALYKRWTEARGISLVSVSMNPITLTEEDMQKVQQLEDAAALGSDPMMLAGLMGDANAAAMKTAAGNSAGAMTGFMGMGMAGGMGMNNIQGLFQQGMQQQAAQQQYAQQQAAAPAQASAPQANGWTCACGHTATGKFCPECGAPKPAENGWTCACGTVNKGKFCENCGAKKPAGEPLYKCDKCGWEPEDPKNPPKFCPECGDPFDANDIQ
ncbi:MAG: SPFH domain-containing protein [Clostridia bacterium]|nr:SPFH domain-containing protein [Clostridia bacterium]